MLTQQFLNKWDGVLPKVMSGDATSIVDLNNN